MFTTTFNSLGASTRAVFEKKQKDEGRGRGGGVAASTGGEGWTKERTESVLGLYERVGLAKRARKWVGEKVEKVVEVFSGKGKKVSLLSPPSFRCTFFRPPSPFSRLPIYPFANSVFFPWSLTFRENGKLTLRLPPSFPLPSSQSGASLDVPPPSVRVELLAMLRRD